MHHAPHTYNSVSNRDVHNAVLETVNYYNFDKSNVVVLILDASKASDNVNY